MDWDGQAPPGQVERPPEAFSGTRGAYIATVLFALVLLVVGASFALTLYLGVQAALDPDGDAAEALDEGAGNIDAAALWTESTFNLLFLGLIPIAWVAFTRVRPRVGTLRYLHLDRPEWKTEVAKGLGIGLLMWLVVLVLGVLQAAIQGELSAMFEDNASAESPLMDAISRNLGWPLAFYVALVAGFAEEVFFRGILQRWLGVWGQGVVFGLTHAGYGTWEQIAYPLALGIAFGFMVKRGWGLPLVIAAHFMFNFVQFAIILWVR